MMKLLILSDIHGNWPALEAVLRAESDYAMAVFCGDLVDYGPQPVECLRWVAGHVPYYVRGRHDHAIAFNIDCRCMDSLRAHSVASRAWHHTLLNESDRAFLGQMPAVHWFQWDGCAFRMAHGTPRGEMFMGLSPDEWSDAVQCIDADFILLGQTHIQGLHRFGRRTVVNPGSVGLACDHVGQACYAVYEGREVHLRRVAYDVNRTVEGLRAAPLREDLVNGIARQLGAATVDIFLP